MKNTFGFLIIGAMLLACSAQADIITDSSGDIDPGIANGNGTLDILGMEVMNNASDLLFTLTVNGNISTTDWGKFMIGIASGKSAGTTTGNGWGRPINLSSPSGGMDFFVGSWVDSGGGAQLWNYSASTWNGPNALSSFSFTAGATSTIEFGLSLATLGLSVGDTIYFDAYASGGGGTDSAVDALSNPNVAITSWGQDYTSSQGGGGLSSYTIVPEPSTIALMGLGILAACRGLKRKVA